MRRNNSIADSEDPAIPAGAFEWGNQGLSPGDTSCFVGSGCPATVVDEIIPSSFKTIVVPGDSSFGAAGVLSQDLQVIDEGGTLFSGWETNTVEGGKEASVFVSPGGAKGREPVSATTGG